MSTQKQVAEQRELIALLSALSVHVGDIIEGLSKRDARFNFIKDSFEEFLSGKFGVREAERLLNADTSNPVGLDELLAQRRYSGLQVESPYQYLAILMQDIINTTLYELLDVFDIDLTLEEVLERCGSSLSGGNAGLLRTLYQKSEVLVPQPAKTTSLGNPILSPPKEDDFRYSNLLEPSSIRVLCIQPGPKESPVECLLEERCLYKDGVEEALSYVWGEPIFDKVLTVNGLSFAITANLYDILRNLRQEDVPRTIWVDAICINQSDLEEKSRQVRLMGEIYSIAQRTSIWLGDWPRDEMIHEANIMESPQDVFASVPDNFGRNLMDQYDLASMLEEFLKYESNGNIWDEKGLALCVMIVRCVNIIVTHEWWERVWTIQEVALSPNQPMIHFRGYCFPYSTVMSGVDASEKIIDMSEHNPDFSESTLVMANMYIALLTQLLYKRANQESRLFLRMLRPEKRIDIHVSNPQDRVLIFILNFVSVYRASDPRDKIFALESLVTRSAGRLINVNYNESTESVFRRITAQVLNLKMARGMFIMPYKFALEPHSILHDDASGPSWVHDFAYSDANYSTGVMAFHKYVYVNSKRRSIYEPRNEPIICLATPKTLFCSGVSAGVIYHTKLVPDLGDCNFDIASRFLPSFLREADQEWSELVMGDRSPRGRMQDPSGDGTLVRNGDAGQSIRPEAGTLRDYLRIGMVTDFLRETWSTINQIFGGKAGLENPILRLDFNEMVALLALDSPEWYKVAKEYDGGDLPTASIGSAFRKAAGTYLFITKNGIVGLASAPIQKGDILCIIYRYPCYVILREVEHQGGGSQNAKKHRLVARAAITENNDEMRARIKRGLKSSVFQII